MPSQNNERVKLFDIVRCLNRLAAEGEFATWWCIMLCYAMLSAYPGAFLGCILRFFGFEPKCIAMCSLITLVIGLVILLNVRIRSAE